jgi:hypothetical protein
MAVFVAALAAGLAGVLGATFRVMWLDDHGRHRPRVQTRRATTHPHAPKAIPRRWT